MSSAVAARCGEPQLTGHAKPTLMATPGGRRMLVVVVVAVLGYYLLLLVGQRWLLYPAPRGPWPLPVPADVERVALPSASGPATAWFLPPAAPRRTPGPVIVFFHGNGERAEHWLSAFGPARQAGFAVLLVEYPGYGEAPGSPTQATLTDAALAAHDWLRVRADVDSNAIVAYGRSLGGAVAVRLATRRPVAALILESTFTSVRAFARRYLAPGFLVRDPLDALTELNGYHGPLLVLHGERDAIVPPAHGRALAAAHAGSQFVSLPCGHNDCEQPWTEVLAFLRRHNVAAPATAAQ